MAKVGGPELIGGVAVDQELVERFAPVLTPGEAPIRFVFFPARR